MITIICVCKQEPGSPYRWRDVLSLSRGVENNLSLQHNFVCLTDDPAIAPGYVTSDPDGRVMVPLRKNWRGWWSKMEVLRWAGPVLYFDLDTVITGNIDQLAQAVIESDKLVLLRGFYKGDRCTGIMGWGGGVDFLWITEAFEADLMTPPEYVDQSFALRMRCKSGLHRGDQEWLDALLTKHGTQTAFVQDLCPGIYSYKVHVQGQSLPDDAKVVCFHGRPRPHEVVETEPWMQEHWMHACHDYQE